MCIIVYHCFAGECWYHIPSPNRQTLKQVSVGRTSVFAVDETGEKGKKGELLQVLKMVVVTDVCVF